MRSRTRSKHSSPRFEWPRPTVAQVLAPVVIAGGILGLVYVLTKSRVQVLRSGRQGTVQWAIYAKDGGCPKQIAWSVHTTDLRFSAPMPFYPQQPLHYVQHDYITIASGCAADLASAQIAVDAVLADLLETN